MNYDFLTVEEYNDVVLEHGEGFREDYALPFSKLNGLTVGTSYIIDGFINVEAKGNNIFDLTVMNELFTGAFCLTDCTSSSYHVVDSDSTEHLLNLQLTIGSDDLADGGLLLHLANTSESFTVTDEPYMITGETVKVGFFNKQTSFNLLIEDNEGEAYTGNVTLDGETVSVTDGVLTFNHTPTASENISLTIGNYHTILRINCVKQNIVYSIDYESSDLYQHIRKAKLVIKTLKGVNGTLKCNGKTVTSTSNNQGVLTFSNIDLGNYGEDLLNCELDLTGSFLNPYSDKFVVDTPRLTGTLQELGQYRNQGYQNTLRPTEYDVTGGGIGFCELGYDIKLNYLANVSTKLLMAYGVNLTLINFSGTIDDANVATTTTYKVIIEDSEISIGNGNEWLRNNINGEIIVNNSTMTFTGNSYAYKGNGKITFNNCIFNRLGVTVGTDASFIKLLQGGDLTLKHCIFNMEFTCTGNTVAMINMFNIDKNAKVNKITGNDLRNNDSFPFNNNKSDINVTYQQTSSIIYDYTSVNGVIWTITGSGERYTQNITITQR